MIIELVWKTKQWHERVWMFSGSLYQNKFINFKLFMFFVLPKEHFFQLISVHFSVCSTCVNGLTSLEEVKGKETVLCHFCSWKYIIKSFPNFKNGCYKSYLIKVLHALSTSQNACPNCTGSFKPLPLSNSQELQRQNLYIAVTRSVLYHLMKRRSTKGTWLLTI